MDTSRRACGTDKTRARVRVLQSESKRNCSESKRTHASTRARTRRPPHVAYVALRSTWPSASLGPRAVGSQHTLSLSLSRPLVLRPQGQGFIPIIHSIIHSIIQSMIHSIIHSVTHSVILSVILSIIHLITHSIIHSHILQLCSRLLFRLFNRLLNRLFI